MERVVRLKFLDPDMAAKLLATGKQELIEGNTWRDVTYGRIMTQVNFGLSQHWVLRQVALAIRHELGLRKQSFVPTPAGRLTA